jgi:hypothetical protein
MIQKIAWLKIVNPGRINQRIIGSLEVDLYTELNNLLIIAKLVIISLLIKIMRQLELGPSTLNRMIGFA